MAPCAYIIHQVRGRTRLRIREKCNDPHYFEAVRRQLDTLAGIDEVRANSTTGTILLLYADQSFDALSDQLQQLGLFEVIDGPEPVKPALAQISSGIAMIDAAITDSSGGRVDLRTLAYIGLMAFTLRQVLRGQFLGPALPMMWEALRLVDRFNGWQAPGDSNPAAVQGDMSTAGDSAAGD